MASLMAAVLVLPVPTMPDEPGQCQNGARFHDPHHTADLGCYQNRPFGRIDAHLLHTPTILHTRVFSGSTTRSKIFTSWVEILLRTNSLPRTPQQSGFSINTTTDTTENTCEKLWYSGFNLTTETC